MLRMLASVAIKTDDISMNSITWKWLLFNKHTNHMFSALIPADLFLLLYCIYLIYIEHYACLISS